MDSLTESIVDPPHVPNLGSRDITTATSVHELRVGNWPLRSLFEADIVFSAAFACHAGPKPACGRLPPEVGQYLRMLPFHLAV
jgi:hypothetical protein